MKEAKYKYLRVKTLRLTVRTENSTYIAELCTPVHLFTNSEKHLATCHPCVLQKNPEQVTLMKCIAGSVYCLEYLMTILFNCCTKFIPWFTQKATK